MNLLLDTHVAVWAVRASTLLPQHIRAMIADPQNVIHVSAVTIWEVAIKHALRRPMAPPFGGDEAIAIFRAAGYAFLDVTAAHAASVETLPPVHGDPFDRLLVAQALSEPMHLITRDGKLGAYGDLVITW